MEEIMESANNADQQSQQVRGILGQFAPRQASLLPALHEVQERLGYIPEHTVGLIAQSLNISVSEIHAALKFYTYFRTEPAAALQIEICQAEACLAMQSQQLTKHIEDYLGCSMDNKTPDGKVELKKVFCLGLCTHGPTAQINEKAYVRLNPQRLEQIIEGLT